MNDPFSNSSSRIPTIAYPGGKARLSKTLVSMMPKSGRIYCEPFAGRGNVLWRAAHPSSKLSFQHWWVNDYHTAAFFVALLLIGGEIVVPPRSRELYQQMREAFRGKEGKFTHAEYHARQREIFIQLVQGISSDDALQSLLLEPYLTFSGIGYSSRHGWSEAALENPNHSVHMHPTTRGFQTTLHQCHDLLSTRGLSISMLDWKDMRLELLGPDDFVYLDPPYFDSPDLHSYKASDINHLELIEVLKNAKFKWMLSEHRQNMYVEAFGEPVYTKELQKLLGGSNSQGPRRMECVWTNYDVKA